MPWWTGTSISCSKEWGWGVTTVSSPGGRGGGVADGENKKNRLQGLFHEPQCGNAEAHLPGAEPKGPAAASMFYENSQHALQGAANSPVDNDGALLLLSSIQVRQIKAPRQHKVQLNGGGLVSPAQGVLDVKVDLGRIKRPIACIHAEVDV